MHTEVGSLLASTQQKWVELARLVPAEDVCPQTWVVLGPDAGSGQPVLSALGPAGRAGDGQAERLQVIHFGPPGEAMSVPCSPVSSALWDFCHQPSNRAVLPQGTAALHRSCPGL